MYKHYSARADDFTGLTASITVSEAWRRIDWHDVTDYLYLQTKSAYIVAKHSSDTSVTLY
jgi:hypothetical protein